MSDMRLLEKLAAELGEDTLEQLLEEAEMENVAEEEAEKVASEYYNLGQIMAIGFQDEMEKEAAGRLERARRLVTRAGGSLRRVGRGLSSRYQAALHAVGSPGSAIQHVVDPVRGAMTRSVERLGPQRQHFSALEKIRAAGKAVGGTTGSELKSLGRAAKGVGIGAASVGALAAPGAVAGYAAGRREKKSYDQGVYDALEYLGLLED